MAHQHNKTAKRGGDIQHDIYKKILSIGYELESSNFAKLTLLDDGILFNTDTVAKNLPKINADYDEDDPMERRKQEPVAFPAYTSYSIDKPRKSVDPNVLFQVLNDIAETSFNKYLLSLCKDHVEANIAIERETLIEQEADEEEIDENEILIGIKNDLYQFQPLDGSQPYKINFETWNPKDCGTFSDIEWLFTYYKPQKSGDIILDTFINVAKNLTHHLRQLTPIPGNLIMQFSETDREIIGKPKNRILYHYPNSNLYYLQTHRSDKQLGIEDICMVPQMTFSCDIQYASEILKEMVHDTVGKLKLNKEVADKYYAVLKQLDRCVHLLFESYNSESKAIASSSKYIDASDSRSSSLRSINSESGKVIFDPKQTNVKRMKSYVFMILFKLSRYYNKYLPDLKARNKYFKDGLFFNSRHDNGELYKSLKELVSEHFGGASSAECAAIIQDLIIQPKILEKYLVDDIKYVRKNALKSENRLEKSHPKYGDPHYSLISYFEFLEDPIIPEDSAATEGDLYLKSHDWFVYADIDVFSTRMKITNHIVLIELRYFANMVRSYMSSIADNELKSEMSGGICNINNPDVNFVSLRGLNKVIDLYDAGVGIRKSPKSKRRSIKKRSSSKIRPSSSQSV